MGSPTMKLFNALTGAEIREIIKREIANALDRDTNFGHHVTYPIVSWEWHLKVTAYPHEPGHFESQGRGEIRAREGESAEASKPVGEPASEPVVAEFDGARSATVPDAVRVQEGISIPEQAPGNRAPRGVARSVEIKKGVDVRSGAQRAKDAERRG